MTDPEVKDRLEARVEALDEAWALDPPPISLKLERASTTDAVTGLSRAVGVKMALVGEEGARVSVNEVDQPFAKVYLDMCRDGILKPALQGQVRLQKPGLTTGVISGPFLLAPLEVKNAGRAANGGPVLRVLSYVLVFDPRMVVTAGRVEMSSVVDDAGNELVAARQVGGLGASPGQWVLQGVYMLAGWPGGKKIVSAKGVAHLTVRVAQRKVEIPDVAKQGTAPIRAGDWEVTFTNFAVRPDQVVFNARARQVDANGVPVPRPPAARGGRMRGVAGPGAPVVLTDADGLEVYRGEIGFGLGVGAGGHYRAPVKAVFELAAITKEVDVPFEWKDVALP
ncbi:MAG TPA: hypothetical protein VHQ47_08170 [Phycisphaerae bacterium]|nr:hypothetical protein [Phycisphaerae bacterium]